jgi:molecular chaperone DnaK (HSP70)
MSVVGFDIGNCNCYIAIARAGGIETVDNEYSARCTPAIVAFNSLQRLIGTSAQNQMVTNFKSTVSQVKRLVGRKYDEPGMEAELSQLPYNCVQMDSGEIGIKVNYRGEEKIYLPEQVMAMVLTYLKQTAESKLNSKVSDCVISVPAFYTDFQRRALLSASQIAGLNCLKLMTETSAIALNYGLFKQDVPGPEEKPRRVVFIDAGHSAYQICIAAFNKGKIKILSSSWDSSLGGRDFDYRLRDYFADAFLKKYKVDARTNKRAWIRLGSEVEKIKKQLGTNTTNLPLNIECFMDDKDVSHSINRAEFEKISQDLIDRVEPPLLKAVNDSGLKLEEIDFVEIVGGSSRIPALRAIFEKVFNKPCSTTLNQDEAVVRGCAIQCAMLSHTVKVRDIEVIDAASYPIHIAWDCTKNPEEQYGEMEVFKKHHGYPFTKLLTFPHRVEPFCFRAYYNKGVDIPHNDGEIGEFVVNAVAPTESSEKVKVKVRVRLDNNGCFTVSSASMVETLPPAPVENGEAMDTTEVNGTNGVSEPEKMEESTEGKEKEAVNGKENGEAEMKSEEKIDEPAKENIKKADVKKPKKTTKSTDLVVNKRQKGKGPEELNLLIEVENELISQVRLEKERADAKNAVEEYVYLMREKIYDSYEKYINEDDREKFSALLNSTENWLYEDGEDETKSVYVNKLSELQAIGQPVVDRYYNHSQIPSALEQIGASILHFRKIIDLYSAKDEKYDHIEEAEMKKVEKRIEEKFKWYNDKAQEYAKCPMHVSPAVGPNEILNEKKMIENFCNPIVNKPKPKVEPPKEDATKDKAESDGATTDATKDTPEQNSQMETDSQKTDAPKKSDLEMEVD